MLHQIVTFDKLEPVNFGRSYLEKITSNCYEIVSFLITD